MLHLNKISLNILVKMSISLKLVILLLLVISLTYASSVDKKHGKKLPTAQDKSFQVNKL